MFGLGQGSALTTAFAAASLLFVCLGASIAAALFSPHIKKQYSRRELWVLLLAGIVGIALWTTIDPIIGVPTAAGFAAACFFLLKLENKRETKNSA